jgi:hypothetical protein
MNGRAFIGGSKVDQMPEMNLFDRMNRLCFRENFEFDEPGG